VVVPRGKYYLEAFEYVIAGLGDIDHIHGGLRSLREYPQGTYAYFATNWNATGKALYPYFVGRIITGQVAKPDNTAANGAGVTPCRADAQLYVRPGARRA
jgi:hypothetical protein